MNYSVETAAPVLEADAFVRGEGRRRISLSEFRGTWVVVAFGAGRADVLDLAAVEEAFAADGAVVLAATPADHGSVELAYADEPVRFPILCGIDQEERLTVVVDPDGLVRYVGVHQTARQALAVLEGLVYAPFELNRAA
jgi:hypothetical protein